MIDRASPRWAGLVIHFESPLRVAIMPSSVSAAFSSTNGRRLRAATMKGSLSRRASLSITPVVTDTTLRREVTANVDCKRHTRD